jgi:hypothetical protein
MAQSNIDKINPNEIAWDAPAQVSEDIVWDKTPEQEKGSTLLSGTIKQIGKNIQSPFSNFAKATSLPMPVKKLAEWLDLPFQSMTGAGIAAGQSLGSAIESAKKGETGTAALEAALGVGEAGLGMLNVVPGAAPVMQAFNVGGKALEEISPKGAEVVNYAMTPFKSSLDLNIKKGHKPENWEAPAAGLADVAYQFMLFGLFRKKNYTKPQAEAKAKAIASKIAQKKTLSKEERKIVSEFIPKEKADIQAKIDEIQKQFEVRPETQPPQPIPEIVSAPEQPKIPIFPEPKAPLESVLLDAQGRPIPTERAKLTEQAQAPLTEAERRTMPVDIESVVPPVKAEVAPVETALKVTPKADIIENVRTAMESGEPVKVEPKKAVELSKAEEVTADALANKIAKEPKPTFTDEELQFYTNNPEAVESALLKLRGEKPQQTAQAEKVSPEAREGAKTPIPEPLPVSTDHTVMINYARKNPDRVPELKQRYEELDAKINELLKNKTPENMEEAMRLAGLKDADRNAVIYSNKPHEGERMMAEIADRERMIAEAKSKVQSIPEEVQKPVETPKETPTGIKEPSSEIPSVQETRTTPKSEQGMKLFSIASLAISGTPSELLPFDEETNKKLKVIAGLAGFAGALAMVRGLSPKGMEFFKDVEASAKRSGGGINKWLRSALKSEEAKTLDLADKAKLESVLGGGKLNDIERRIEKIEVKPEKTAPITETGKEIKPTVKEETKFTKVSNDAFVQSVIDATAKPTEAKPITMSVTANLKEKTGVFWLEGMKAGLTGNELVEFVRGNMLETLKTGKGIEGATEGQKNVVIKNLQSKKVEQWVDQWKKNEQFQRTKQEVEIRHDEIANEVFDTFMKSNLSQESLQKLTGILQRYRTTSDKQRAMFAGFKSRVSHLVKSYGAAGGELAGRMYEGDLQRTHYMDIGLQHINKINDIYSEIKNPFEKGRISDAVTRALENRAKADKLLDTPEKKAVYSEAVTMLDNFKAELKARGYNVLEDYYTHIKDVDVLQQVLDDVGDMRKTDVAKLNDFISDKSRFLKPRENADIEINRDLPQVLMTYLRSVSKELAYREGVDYYYTKFAKDIPIALKSSSSKNAMNYMKNVLDPAKGEGLAWFLANKARSNMYRNFLGMNFKASVLNLTQKEFARLQWTDEANSIVNKIWRKKTSLTGAFADAVQTASRETPRFLEMTKSELPNTPRTASELFNRIDTFQKTEGRNWGITELGSIINSAVKNPEYKALKENLGDVGAINKILENKVNFDKAVREAAITSAETQVAAAPSMRGEIYDAPLHRLLGMFTAFKTRQLQVFKEALQKQEGIKGTRAQHILRRGMTMEVKPVEVLREVEGNRVAFEKMLKDAKKNNESLGVPYKDVQQFIDFLKGKEKELNTTIKELEQTPGRVKNAVRISKYLTKVAAISTAFSVFWDMVDMAVYGEDQEKNVVARSLQRAFWDILPSPFYGLNPQKFFVSPVAPNLEHAQVYGKFSGRGLTRDLISYGLNVAPFAGLADRVTGKRISKAIIDVAVPKKEKPKAGAVDKQYGGKYESSKKSPKYGGGY